MGGKWCLLVCALWLPAVCGSQQAASVAVKAPGPASWALVSFHDAATGVSFRYPAAFQARKDVTGYFSPALTRIKGVTLRAKLAWVPRPPHPLPDEAWTDLEQLDFLYATIPEPAAAACERMVSGNGDGSGASPASISVHGVRFAVGEVSDAGLSHFVSGKMYATYRGRTCYVFEQDTLGLDGYVGDVTTAQFKALDRRLDAIVQTVRFDQP